MLDEYVRLRCNTHDQHLYVQNTTCVCHMSMTHAYAINQYATCVLAAICDMRQLPPTQLAGRKTFDLFMHVCKLPPSCKTYGIYTQLHEK